MTLVRVEGIPDNTYKNKSPNNVIEVLDNFLASDMKCARVVWEPYGYANVNSARAALYQTRRRQKYPIDIASRNGELYIIKREA